MYNVLDFKKYSTNYFLYLHSILYNTSSTGMLNSDDLKKKDSSVKCLEVLSTSKPDHWRSILEAGMQYM